MLSVEENQLSLFDEQQNGFDIEFLHLVKDMEPIKMSIEDLFNASLFDELLAVTYVASPKFFFSITNKFKKISLILGIEDGDVAGPFASGLDKFLDVEARITFFQSLPISVKENICANQYHVRYAKQGISVHSKFYLLKGENTNRVIMGSANFTENAFRSKKQFEDIIVFDNSPLFEVYRRRYLQIYEQTSDYIPEIIKTRSLKEQIWVADPEIIKDILLDEITKNRVILQLSEDEMEKIKLLPDKIEVEKENVIKFKQIVEVITKKETKSKTYKFLPLAELKQKAVAIKSIISKTHKKSEELDNRFHLIYNDVTHLLYTGNLQPLKEENHKNQELIPFSKPIGSHEKLLRSLELINKFIEAYSLFTAREDIRNQSRICEIIIYSFMAAYIWKMREHYATEEGRESVRRHFPPFLIIAGRSMSGKTTALEFVGMLLGNIKPYMAYEQVKDANILWDYFHSSNVNPILIDEIDPKFFTSSAAKRGERLIKFISNERKGKHPALIGTTNATGFDVNSQTAMRIYYLQIDNTFQKSLMSSSSKYLSEIMTNIDSSLFQDFTYRMSQTLKDCKEFYSSDDFLHVARMIFKSYYSECGLDLPDWFPEGKFNDYDERGKFIWRELFRSHRQNFDVRDDNSIFINIDEFGNQTNKDKTNKINFLPPECIIEDGPVLVINKELFFKFIEWNDVSNISILQKLAKIFRSSN
ncbi:phospholipase D family protein [Brevibacillus sp. SYSU BS000544]|uniref:phospholipase D family protein n=1 Tax=Brevibacillus sp. SYSU BS000544 TaxID=3416443 RepID=UPI003CE5ADEC